MAQVFERLAEMLRSPPPADGHPDPELCALLASLTPEDLTANVLPEHYLAVVEMICNHVPGYGPH
jgi:hypothetical protein